MKAGLIAINLAAVIFGTAALFGELHVSPFWIVCARGGFAAVTLVLVGMLRGGLAPRLALNHWKMLLITGLLLAFHWLTFFASVQLSGIPIATLTFATFPLFTVIIDAVMTKRIPRWFEVAAGIAIVIAVSLLVDFRESGPKLQGTFVGFLSAISFAAFGILAKTLSTKLSSLTTSFAQNLIVFVLLLPILPFVESHPASTQDWLWLVVLGVLTTAIMHQLYLFALSRLSAATCSAFIALEPVYAILFAAILFGQPLTFWVIVSGVLIVAASVVLLRSEAPPEL